MKKRELPLLVLLALLPALLPAQTLCPHRNQVSGGYNFWVSTPKDYDSLQPPKPVILFLHGTSLCGRNLDRVRRYGPLHAQAMGRQIDAVIIAPQNPGGAWKPDRVNRVVDWVFDHYRIDTSRFYVIGMSLGGYGTIDYTAAYPHRIAAAMALCGGGNPKSYCGLNDVPLWILHGTADRAVRVSQSQKVINAMARCGDSPRLRFTKLPGVNHGGLARAFYISETYDWLFQHRLDTPGRPVSTDCRITVERLRSAYKDIDRNANHIVVRSTPDKEALRPASAAAPSAADTMALAAGTAAADSLGLADSAAAPQPPAAKASTPQPKYHTIRSGDTLGALARRYHTTVAKLCRLNNMKETSILRVGRRLRVR